jgi:hypothetical protein
VIFGFQSFARAAAAAATWEVNMQRMTLHTLAAAAFALLFAVATASAQAPVRVRGTIEQAEGNTLMVKSREGAAVKVTLTANASVVGIVKAALSDIKQGSYVGITAMPQPDGTLRAVEVHIFPESMRGIAEGHRPWDLQPQSTMTNANVEQLVTGVDGQTLTLKYKDGEKKIFVPKDAVIVTYVPGNKADLKPGIKIFIAAAKKNEDGSLEAERLSYGKDGLTPPM